MTVIAVLGALALLGTGAYLGYRGGAYGQVVTLLRHVFALLVSMTLFEHVAGMLVAVGPATPYWPLYMRAVSLGVIYGAVISGTLWLKIKYTPPIAPCETWFDRVGGTLCGALSALVVTGFLLVLWTMIPFVRWAPWDMARIRGLARIDGNGEVRASNPLLASGIGVLRFYSVASNRAGGARTFLLQDEELVQDVDGDGRYRLGDSWRDVNNNGRWDKGWATDLLEHADFRPQDLSMVLGGTQWEDVGTGSVSVGGLEIFPSGHYTLTRRGDSVQYSLTTQRPLPDAVLMHYAVVPGARGLREDTAIYTEGDMGQSGSVAVDWSRFQGNVIQAAVLVAKREDALKVTTLGGERTAWLELQGASTVLFYLEGRGDD